MTAALTFTSPEQFERSLLRITVGAALGGLAAGLLSLIGIDPPVLMLPLGAALGALGERRGRFLLAMMGSMAGAVASASTVRPTFYLALAGAIAGCGVVLARVLNAAPGSDRQAPSTWVWVGAAIAGALTVAVGSETVAVFDSHGLFTTWFSEPVPLPLATALRGALGGFFFGLSSGALHVTTGLDSVESLYLQAERELSGELARLSFQAVELYRKCRDTLVQQAGQTPAQHQLRRSLEEVTRRALELARRWHGVDVELGERAEAEVEKRIAEVRGLIEKATDPSAKRQLQTAEKALNEEMAQIKRIRAGRERVVARLHGDLAILERTRFALLAIRSSDAHLKAAELSTLSDNLSALGRELDIEAKAIDEALRSAMHGDPALILQPVTEVAAPAETKPAAEIELTR